MPVLSKTSHIFEHLKSSNYNIQYITSTASASGERSTRWYMFDQSSIKLIPMDINSNYYTIGYIQRPTVMTLDADTPDARILEVHHEHLKYAASFYLLTMKGDTQNVDFAGKMFETFKQLIGVSGEVR